MKIAVVGASGRLGSELCRQAPDAIRLTRPEIDLTAPATIDAGMQRHRPDVVVNVAAFNRVDAAETEPGPCWAVNADAVAYLARACAELNAILVQVSTDYVFHGDWHRTVSFREDESPSPRSVYARSKFAGEEFARQASRHLIVRTCGLYGGGGSVTSKHCFVETILQRARQRLPLRVVHDQICSPSSVVDVTGAILSLVRHNSTGIWHVVNKGAVSWYDFAVEILRLSHLETAIQPISTAEFGAAAERPPYSALDPGRYESFGEVPLPTWQEALATYVARPGPGTGPSSVMENACIATRKSSS